MERLQRSIGALGEAAQEESEASRAKAAVQALSGVLLKAVARGASHEMISSLVAEEIGVSRRVAANALRPFLKLHPSGNQPEDKNPENAPPSVSPTVQKPTSHHKATSNIGTDKSTGASSSLTSGSMKSSSASSAPMAGDGKPLPPLPADLMPKDGQMPPVPGSSDYRIEHRPDGSKVFVINGDRYSLLPGMDPTAPYGRYVDGRPMNEYGAPIGDGPPVTRGKFIGENF